MCGITGFFDFGEKISPQFYPQILEKMSHTLKHRGPNDAGIWFDEENKIGFGFRRLSILDLSSSGYQPMLSYDQRYVMVFNGEIYNYKDLKKEIGTEKVISWKSETDTEVLLEAISLWGLEPALKKADGMFAIALWDKREKKLSFARDRFGEKPLYYSKFENSIIFGSELKSLRVFPCWEGEVDPKGLAFLVRYNSIPAPHTIYKNCYKLESGQIISFTTKGECKKKKYWEAEGEILKDKKYYLSEGPSKAIEDLRQLFIQKIEGCLEADVPVGAFLSGGIDSSLIVSIIKKELGVDVNTYTIGFENQQFDESRHAQAIADYLSTNHTQQTITHSKVLDIVEQLPEIYDEPFADQAQIPTIFLSEIAKKSVTVALSGDGGDELFGGYQVYSHCFQQWQRMLNSQDSARYLNNLLGLTPYLQKKINNSCSKEQKKELKTEIINNLYYEFYDSLKFPGAYNQQVILGKENIHSIYESKSIPKELNAIERLFFVDSLFYLPDQLEVKVDRAAMSKSLEVRAPFLDKDIFSFSYSIPFEYRLHPMSGGKWILRQILAKYIPTNLTERPKQGFCCPIDDWLRTFLRPWVESLLNKTNLEKHPFVDLKNIQQIWSNHLNGDNHQKLLWPILMYLNWYNLFNVNTSENQKSGWVC